ELLSDMEKLLAEIKENSKSESKSTTIFGLGRFLLKLATGNPLAAVVDVALTKKTARDVGKRTNVLTEMEFLVSSLEQYLHKGIEDGRLVYDSSKLLDQNREDIASILNLGVAPRVLAKLM